MLFAELLSFILEEFTQKKYINNKTDFYHYKSKSTNKKDKRFDNFFYSSPG